MAFTNKKVNCEIITFILNISKTNSAELKKQYLGLFKSTRTYLLACAYYLGNTKCSGFERTLDLTVVFFQTIKIFSIAPVTKIFIFCMSLALYLNVIRK